ncbi:MAG: RsmB/NOP family class I SAM-dependent RNA methyltransferase [Alphaproteobacteria bacterium]|nr:RsmB/NOP family class I SAM-dependent RNA methyltransferase [Alphaproteobacteria bacterium]
MTPGARVQAAIDLLEAMSAAGHGPGASARRAVPADQVANRYFRDRRYIGSKDRVAISRLVYGIIRRRAQIDDWIVRASDLPQEAVAQPDPRSRIIAGLALLDGWTAQRIGEAFSGGKFHPAPMSWPEQKLTTALDGRAIDDAEQSESVRFNCPDWLLPSLRARFGATFEVEMAALEKAAPLDLRVNLIKGERDAASLILAAAEVKTEPTPFSPTGLRAKGRPNLNVLEAFRSGLVEVQDEGSQLAALLVDARPGMRVCDFCAGAGGKSLAIAARMANKGRVVACDTSDRRLDGATRRLRRAGVHNVERRHLTSERDAWVKRHAGGFERVLIDAPCSGTGTWRRNPDARWTLDPNDIVELTALQARLLESAARLVKPGGRLIYVTCSFLPEENERQADAFAAAESSFTLVPISRVWAETIGGVAPSPDPYLRLSPAAHSTDGFFIAVFERRADAVAETERGPSASESTNEPRTDADQSTTA